jgi:type II secretory pathway component PulK
MAHRHRRGITLVAVLICLLAVMLLGASLLKIALAQRGINRDLERRLQAEWLVESGVERALARIAADPDYTGETWSISAADLGLSEAGQPGSSKEKAGAGLVTIGVDRPAGETNRRRIRIQADYPRDEPRRSRHSQEISLDLEPRKTGVTP